MQQPSCTKFFHISSTILQLKLCHTSLKVDRPGSNWNPRNREVLYTNHDNSIIVSEKNFVSLDSEKVGIDSLFVF